MNEKTMTEIEKCMDRITLSVWRGKRMLVYVVRAQNIDIYDEWTIDRALEELERKQRIRFEGDDVLWCE